MNSKLLAGSIMTGFGVLGAVLDAWASHLFFTMFHVAKAQAIESTGSFSPGPYSSPTETSIFLGIRVVLWAVILVGLVLVSWGIGDEYAPERMP